MKIKIININSSDIGPKKNNTTKKRGLVCLFCGKGFGYRGEIPDEKTIKEAYEHEAECPKNPYKAKIKQLNDIIQSLEQKLTKNEKSYTLDEIKYYLRTWIIDDEHDYNLNFSLRTAIDYIDDKHMGIDLELKKRSKVSTKSLSKIDFPDCFDKCPLANMMGVSECDSTCPHKFKKAEN